MIERKIIDCAVNAVRELFGQEPDPALLNLEKTRKEFKGDFTLVVFPLLKISRRSPEETAKALGARLTETMPEVVSFEVIKGFLNLELSDEYWYNLLQSAVQSHSFGFIEEQEKSPVVLEYSSPNTNKPLHLGHIRNNLLGFSLAEILKACGKRVVRVNLVNDRGIHICKSMLAYRKWGMGETPASSGMKGDHLIGKYYVMFDRHFREELSALKTAGLSEEMAEQQSELLKEAREVLRLWEAGDPDTVALWKMMNGWAYEGFDVTYKRLGVAFDHIYYESETYLLGKEMVNDGLAKGVLTRRDDGSVWADLRDQGLDEKLLLRSDGTSVYMTQDMGTAQIRYLDYHPSSMIYVVGNEQNYHFDVLKIVLSKLGMDYASMIHHLSYGMVELPEGKMKSREGKVVDADDLMDEMYRTAEETTRELGKADELSEEDASRLFHLIGMGALKYFILKVDPKKNMLFNPSESIDFNGNTGPFIQYTHARIKSLLSRGISAGNDPDLIPLTLTCPMHTLEKEAIKRLASFPFVVHQAGEEMDPSLVAGYAYELAREFNQLYQELPVLKEANAEKVLLRLALARLTGDVLKKAMGLLGIGVPDRM